MSLRMEKKDFINKSQSTINENSVVEYFQLYIIAIA